MADAAEWTEELVAEYLELRGYAVVRNLPTTIGSRGGRSDADIVAFKSLDVGVGRPRLRVIDAEAGTTYWSANDIAEHLRRKFSKERRSIVLEHVASVSGQPARRMNYERMYFDFAWLSENGVLADLAKELSPSVRVIGIERLVNAIVPGVTEWKKANQTRKGSLPSLPERFPALQIVLACMYSWSPKSLPGAAIA